MAHGITMNDSMFSAVKKPWHYAETQNRVQITEDVLSSWDALQASGLTWEVVPSPVFVNNNRVDGYIANVRKDTGDVLGVVSNRYKIYQNAEGFSFIDAILGKEAKFETAGSLWGGKRVWMLARLDDVKFVGDDVEVYLFVTLSHDGKAPITCGVSSIRIVCNNTLNLACNNAKRMWTTRHTGNLQEKKYEAIKALQLSSTYIEEASALADHMASVRISQNDLNMFLDNLFPMNEALMSEREKRNISYCRNNIIDLYTNKEDLMHLRGTSWGLYNAVADFVSNAEPLRKTKTFAEKAFERFLDGDKVLAQAQKILATVG